MRNYVKTSVVMLFFFGLTPTTTHANEVVIEATNWEKQAIRSLTFKGERLTLNEMGGFIETEKKPLCVRLNNYGCVKQGNEPWDGSDGRRDSKGHAVFNDPTYSVRAVVRDYCTKHKSGIRSAVELANAYSPWCDTLGSIAVYKGWGRSCSDSPQPPSGFVGPICKRPDGEPTEKQCASCNCPNRLAKQWLIGLEQDGNTPKLMLFDSNGKPNVVALTILLKNKIRIELGGFEPTDAVLERGISLAGTCR
jgi:hypothetical protein